MRDPCQIDAFCVRVPREGISSTDPGRAHANPCSTHSCRSASTTKNPSVVMPVSAIPNACAIIWWSRSGSVHTPTQQKKTAPTCEPFHACGPTFCPDNKSRQRRTSWRSPTHTLVQTRRVSSRQLKISKTQMEEHSYLSLNSCVRKYLGTPPES